MFLYCSQSINSLLERLQAGVSMMFSLMAFIIILQLGLLAAIMYGHRKLSDLVQCTQSMHHHLQQQQVIQSRPENTAFLFRPDDKYDVIDNGVPAQTSASAQRPVVDEDDTLTRHCTSFVNCENSADQAENNRSASGHRGHRHHRRPKKKVKKREEREQWVACRMDRIGAPPAPQGEHGMLSSMASDTLVHCVDDDDVDGDGFDKCGHCVDYVLSVPTAAKPTYVATSTGDDGNANMGGVGNGMPDDVDYEWALVDDGDFETDNRYWPDIVDDCDHGVTGAASGTSGACTAGIDGVNDDEYRTDHTDDERPEGEPKDEVGNETLPISGSGKVSDGDSGTEVLNSSTADDSPRERSLIDEISFRLKRLVWLIDSVTTDRQTFDRLPPLVAGTLKIASKEIEALTGAWVNVSSQMSTQQQEHRLTDDESNDCSVQQFGCKMTSELKSSQSLAAGETQQAKANGNRNTMLMRRQRPPNRYRHHRVIGWVPADEPLVESDNENGD